MDRLNNPKELNRLIGSLGAYHLGIEFVLSEIGPNCLAQENARYVSSVMSHPVKMIGAGAVLCLHGTITYRINLSSLTLNANNAMIIPPESIMEVIDADDSVHIISLSFAKEYYETIALSSIRLGVSPSAHDAMAVILSQNEMKECLCICEALKYRLANNAESTDKEVIFAYIRTFSCILFSLGHRGDISLYNADGMAGSLFKAFLDKVYEDYRTFRSVQHYADALCVTPKYLSRVVKEVSGRNALSIIDDMVILEAKAKLKTRRYTVKQISDSLNFPNPSFFAKYFKHHCRLTPIEYAKS